MDFAFSEDQELVRREARRYLAGRYPSAEAPGADSWREIAKLGWTGISVPVQHGGAGLGFLDEAVLFEELGRALFTGPYLATVAMALPAAAPELQERIAAGERTASVQLGDWPAPDRDAVDEVIVLEDGELAETVRQRALAALALEAVGIAQRALELGVEHASTREQFGKPIGTYQAVSHKLADTYADTELARSLAYWAAWCVAEGDGLALVAARSAKAFSADAAVLACERSIQVHGGLGFTWEHVLQRYYKRAMWIQSFGGHGARHRAEVARFLLD